jgi:hypothetical protein
MDLVRWLRTVGADVTLLYSSFDVSKRKYTCDVLLYENAVGKSIVGTLDKEL